MQENLQILTEFLSVPLTDGNHIFQKFSQLPGAYFGKGPQPLQRYVFVPGTRRHPVVLVAHADTVWDAAYGKQAQNEPVFADGRFFGAAEYCGIGADDRAGCAMLWALRDSGHSLLVVDGEEHGKVGARFLRQSNRKLFRRLNGHRFMLELDWRGTGGCLYNQVDNTQNFKDYIAGKLGFQDDQQKGGCDLQILCQKVCGANVGIGYHNYHTPRETLVLSEWENTLHRLGSFLEQEHPRFPIPWCVRFRRFLGRCKGKLASVVRRVIPKRKRN